MHIQRYTAKIPSTLESITPAARAQSHDFEWLLGDEQIGIIGRRTTYGISFTNGLFTEKDQLLLYPSHGLIARLSNGYGRIGTDPQDKPQVQRLVALLSNDVTHAYEARTPNDPRTVIVFSKHAPSAALYTPNGQIPIQQHKP